MNLKDNVERVKERIINAQQRCVAKKHVKIVAITKTQPANVIVEAQKVGLNIVGENRIQEAGNKFAEIPETLPQITKRLVGHLQSNKLNKALSLFDAIDSVDSYKLANKIGNKSKELGRNLPILLEVNTSGENSKFGFKLENINELLQCFEIDGISINGLMTIGPITTDEKLVRKAFIDLRELSETIKNQITNISNNFCELSMGMSGDFEIAVEEGATMVRLGTVLFGKRN